MNDIWHCRPVVVDISSNYTFTAAVRKRCVGWKSRRTGCCFQPVLAVFSSLSIVDCWLSDLGLDVGCNCWWYFFVFCCRLSVVKPWLLFIGCRCRWLLLVPCCRVSVVGCWLSVSNVAHFFYRWCPALLVRHRSLCPRETEEESTGREFGQNGSGKGGVQ